MDEMLTLCGYRCDLCQFYTGTTKSKEDREKVSREFKRIFGFDIKPEDVECVGCKNEGKHADTGCPVRPCAMEKGLENCAHCGEFICDKLKERINFVDEFSRGNKKPLSEEDVQLYLEPYRSKERMVRLHKELKKGSP